MSRVARSANGVYTRSTLGVLGSVLCGCNSAGSSKFPRTLLATMAGFNAPLGVWMNLGGVVDIYFNSCNLIGGISVCLKLLSSSRGSGGASCIYGFDDPGTSFMTRTPSITGTPVSGMGMRWTTRILWTSGSGAVVSEIDVAPILNSGTTLSGIFLSLPNAALSCGGTAVANNLTPGYFILPSGPVGSFGGAVTQTGTAC